jgi:type IV pilus assembly protein PilZ
VFLLLTLLGESEKIPVAARVIWVTPRGASGRRAAGIGVQFHEQDGERTRRKIEAYLAGVMAGDKPTHTM